MPTVGVLLMPAVEELDTVPGHGEHVGIDVVQGGVAFAVVFEVAGAFGFSVGDDETVAGGYEIVEGHGSDGVPQRGHIDQRAAGSEMGGECCGDAEGEIEGGDGGRRDVDEQVV